MRNICERIASLCISLAALFMGCFAATIVSGMFVFKRSEMLRDWHIPRIFWWNMVLFGFLGLCFLSVFAHCMCHYIATRKR